VLRVTLLGDRPRATHPLPVQLELPNPIAHPRQRNVQKLSNHPRLQIDIHGSLSEVLWRRLQKTLRREQIRLILGVTPRPPSAPEIVQLLGHVSRSARP
jgi:hypothetical protein